MWGDPALWHPATRACLELNGGLPWLRRGKVQVTEHPPGDDLSLEIEQSNVEELDLVDSAAYQVIAKAYATHKGELACSLMSKDFIPSANASMMVNMNLLDELRD